MKSQTIKDRVNAAVQGVVGDPVSLSIYKATTEEEIPPKEKHLCALYQFTRERTVSYAQMSAIFSERLTSTNYYVIVKSISVIHYLMINGEESFLAFLSSDKGIFKIKIRIDSRRSDSHGASLFIKKYMVYLKAKSENYFTLGFDICRIPKGSKSGSLQSKGVKALLEMCALFHVQSMCLFELLNEAFSNYNTVARFANSIIKKDSIQLYLCYNDAAIGLMDKFFTLDKKIGHLVYDEYSKFMKICENFNHLFSNSKEFGVGGAPTVIKISPAMLEPMMSHLESLETKHEFVTAAPTEIKKPESELNINQKANKNEQEKSQFDDFLSFNDIAPISQSEAAPFDDLFSMTHNPHILTIEPQDIQDDLFDSEFTPNFPDSQPQINQAIIDPFECEFPMTAHSQQKIDATPFSMTSQFDSQQQINFFTSSASPFSSNQDASSQQKRNPSLITDLFVPSAESTKPKITMDSTFGDLFNAPNAPSISQSKQFFDPLDNLFADDGLTTFNSQKQNVDLFASRTSNTAQIPSVDNFFINDFPASGSYQKNLQHQTNDAVFADSMRQGFPSNNQNSMSQNQFMSKEGSMAQSAFPGLMMPQQQINTVASNNPMSAGSMVSQPVFHGSMMPQQQINRLASNNPMSTGSMTTQPVFPGSMMSQQTITNIQSSNPFAGQSGMSNNQQKQFNMQQTQKKTGDIMSNLDDLFQF